MRGFFLYFTFVIPGKQKRAEGQGQSPYIKAQTALQISRKLLAFRHSTNKSVRKKKTLAQNGLKMSLPCSLLFYAHCFFADNAVLRTSSFNDEFIN